MSAAKMRLFLLLSSALAALSCFCLGGVGLEQQWPVPYIRHTSRPAANSYCKAQYTFCPTGTYACVCMRYIIAGTGLESQLGPNHNPY